MKIRQFALILGSGSLAFTAVSCTQSEFQGGAARKAPTSKPAASAEQVAVVPKPATEAPKPAAEAAGSIPKEIAECATKTLSYEVMSLSFPATEGKCTWDIGEISGVMAGHMEQTMSLAVPANWVVCGMNLSAANNNFYYDDQILLHFNERVLIGSTGIIDMLDKDAYGLPVFNWSKLQRKKPSGSKTCLDGATACALPGTQQNGPLQLELDDATNLKLMSHAFKTGRFDFQVVATGDNDENIDCAHTGLPLVVTLKYYTK